MRAPLAMVVMLLVLSIALPLVDAQNITIGTSALPATAPIAGAPNIELLGPVSALPSKARINVFLEVVNLGPGGAHNVTVTAQPSTGGLIVVGQVERSLDDIPSNKSAGLAVRIATPDQAGGATLSLTFSFVTDAGALVTVTRVVNMQISPPETSPLDVTFASAPLVAGEQGNLTLNVTNPSSSEVTNLDVQVQPMQNTPLLTAQTSLTPGNASALVLHGARLGPARTVTVNAPVVASLRPQDLLPFTVTAQYTLNGFARSQSFDFGARVIGSIHLRVLDARVARSDSGLALAGTIVNTGTGTAWNPRVTVAPGSGLRAVQPDLVADLKPNQAEDFFVPVEQTGAPIAGASLVTVDWNDDFGKVGSTDVQGQAAPLPPEPPGFFARVWAGLRGPWGLALLAVAALVVGATIIRHVGRAHREAEEEEAARVESGSDASRRTPPPPSGGRPGGKRPRAGH